MEPLADPGSAPTSSTGQQYRMFAETEAGTSPRYRQWALGVADDATVVSLIDQLPPRKRQVNLVFASARYLGAPIGHYSAFRDWMVSNWPAVESVALTHATQTNEPARCAMLLPLLATLPGPLALLEVGASAGLCLFPDRYSYRYNDREQLDPPDGPSDVLLETRASGPVPYPTSVPNVVWRAGIDLNPLDVADPDTMAWLDALIWPEHDDRRSRLRSAARIARHDPPRIVAGNLLDELPVVAASAPPDATLVIFHTAVLAYLSANERSQFVHMASNLPGHWISNEGRTVTPGVAERLGMRQSSTDDFVVALDGTPVAFSQPHGRKLQWLGVR